MIAFPRSLAKRFRTVLRRCPSAADFSRDPLIVARASSKGLSLQAVLSETAVRFDQPGNLPDEVIAFPASLLAKIGGSSDDLVALKVLKPEEGRASWLEKGANASHEFKAVQPEDNHFFPAAPARLTDPGEYFKLALDEAAATASRDVKRLSMFRVLLRGKTGEVVATDGRQLLIQGGFKFPWSGDVLVPAIGVWGLRELPDKPVSISCSKQHLFVHVGMWSFALKVETGKPYPKFEVAIPPPRSITTQLRFSPADLELLKKHLPRMPEPNESPTAITLDIGKKVAVRAKGDDREADAVLELPGAVMEGKPVRVAMNRLNLLRAVKMGFFDIEIVNPTTPFCCRQGNRTFVCMPLDEPKQQPQPRQQPQKPKPLQQPPGSVPAPVPSTKENPTMPDNNGKHAGTGDGPPNSNGFSDPLMEAEAIKGLLGEAQMRLARLIATLKHFRKQSRAVRAAVQSLQQLPPLTP